MLVDDSERQRRARIAATLRANSTTNPEQWWEHYYYHLYDPERVRYDLPLYSTVAQDMRSIGDAGYMVVQLTGRPETMRKATEGWLQEHQLSLSKRTFLPNRLIMRPPRAFLIALAQWKAQSVTLLANVLQATEVFFVDDEQETRLEVVRTTMKYPFAVRCFSSLPELLSRITGNEEAEKNSQVSR